MAISNKIEVSADVDLLQKIKVQIADHFYDEDEDDLDDDDDLDYDDDLFDDWVEYGGDD